MSSMNAGMPDSTPLGDARAWLRSKLDKGAPCPCCKQRAQLYRRKINSGMARSLIQMYRINGTGWVHLPTAVGARSREEGKLAYWKLVEEQQANGLHGGRAGYWRVTMLGEEFVKLQTTVPKYALVYNGHVQGYDQTSFVDIKDALGTKFQYQDLMAGV